MTFVVDDDEFTAGPRVVDPPWSVEGATEVEPAVDEPSPDSGQSRCISDDFVRREPRVVAPAVGHLPSEPEAKSRIGEARVWPNSWSRRHMGVFPTAPRNRGRFPDCRIGVHEQRVVRVDQSALPQRNGDVVMECLPLDWEEPSHVARQPVDVGLCTGADSSKNKSADSFRVTFSVRCAEDRSPGHSEYDPPLYAEMHSKPLDVIDVVMHVDAGPVHAFVARVRGAPPCCSLVKQHGSMSPEVEVASRPWRAARARPPVQIHDRRALPRPDLLIVESMPAADVETPCRKGFGCLLSHRGMLKLYLDVHVCFWTSLCSA